MPEPLNQLHANEIIAKKSDFTNLIASPQEERRGIRSEVWFLTISPNIHWNTLLNNPELFENLTNFFIEALNHQVEFFEEFFYFKKNSRWEGDPEPPGLPVDMDKVKYLHIEWAPEIQLKSANQYLHVHVTVNVAFEWTMGLSLSFGKNFASIAEELFGRAFYIHTKFADNPALAMKFYMNKGQRLD